jgi:hypothetical protein
VLVAVVLIGTPHVIRWYLQHWLEDNGAIEIEIGDVDFNPFSGRAEVRYVRFTSDESPQYADRLVVRMTWTGLLRRQLLFEKIAIRDASIRVRRTESNRLFLAAVAVGGAEAVDTAQEVEKASGWGVGLAGVELDNVIIHYLDPLLDYQVRVPRFSLDRMTTWEPDRETRLDGRLEIEDASLDLAGTMRPFADQFSMQAEVTIRGVPLGRLLTAFPEWGLDNLAGTAELSGALEISEGDEGVLVLSHTGDVGGSGLRVARQGSEYRAGSAAWAGELVVTSEAAGAKVEARGRLEFDAAAGHTAGQGSSLSADALVWDGGLLVESAGERLGVEVDGVLTTAAAAIGAVQGDGRDAPDFGLSMDDARLEADGLKLESSADALEVAGDLSMSLTRPGGSAGTASLGMNELGWQGQVTARVADGQASVGAKGLLEMSELSAADRADTATLESVRWDGDARVRSADALRFAVGGEARLNALEVRRKEVGLLRIDGVLAKFAAGDEAGAVELDSLQLESIDALQRPGSGGEPPFVVTAPSVNLASVSISPDRLDLGNVSIDGAVVWLQVAPGGKLELRDILTAIQDSDAEAEASAAPLADEPGFGFSVDGIETVSPVKIVYRDETVTPGVELEFAPMAIKIGRIDSASPDADTRLTLTTGMNRYGKLAYDGTIRPLATRHTAVGKGTADGLDVTAFDGYSRRNNGYRVDSGTVSADIDVDIREDSVDSLARLNIRELEVARIVPEEEDAMGQELGLPLDAAFSLLKDKEGDIKLDVPLEGDLSELSADFGHALRIVLNKGVMLGVRTAASTFFAPLWPVLAAEKVVGAMNKLRFKPVEFVPGQGEVAPAGIAYLDELAGLIGQRPEVSLRICGRSVTRDRVALFPDRQAQPPGEEQLTSLKALAIQRQRLVKDALIERGIEAARVVTCSPDPTAGDDGPPRVDVGI